MAKKLLVGILFILLIAAVFWVSWQFSPRVASSVFRTRNSPTKTESIAGNAVIDEDEMKFAQPPRIYRGRVKLEYPSSIKVTETINVKAWFQPEGAYPATAQGKLDSGDFKITSTIPTTRTVQDFKYEWNWLLSPDKAGSKSVYFWIDPSTRLTLDGAYEGVNVKPGDNKILLPIVVKTDLGLTAATDGLARAIGAVLTLAMAIIGGGLVLLKRKPAG